MRQEFKHSQPKLWSHWGFFWLFYFFFPIAYELCSLTVSIVNWQCKRFSKLRVPSAGSIFTACQEHPLPWVQPQTSLQVPQTVRFLALLLLSLHVQLARKHRCFQKKSLRTRTEVISVTTSVWSATPESVCTDVTLTIFIWPLVRCWPQVSGFQHSGVNNLWELYYSW